jgi:hypothetical protein
LSFPGIEFVDEIANGIDHFEIATLAAAADVVAFAGAARADDFQQRLGVILDKQPIANVLPATVNRSGRPSSALMIISGISFSGKVGPIVVKALDQGIGVLLQHAAFVGAVREYLHTQLRGIDFLLAKLPPQDEFEDCRRIERLASLVVRPQGRIAYLGGALRRCSKGLSLIGMFWLLLRHRRPSPG